MFNFHRKKAGSTLENSDLQECHEKALQSANTAFHSISSHSADEEKKLEAEMISNIWSIHKAYTDGNKQALEKEQKENLSLTYHHVKKRIETEFPCLFQDTSAISKGYMFYDENEVHSKLMQLQEQAETQYMTMFATTDEERIKTLRNLFKERVNPLIQQCAESNLVSMNLAKSNATTLVQKLKQNYTQSITKKIQQITCMNTEILDVFHSDLLEIAKNEYDDHICGPESFQLEWKRNLQEEILQEKLRIESNLQSTIQDTSDLLENLTSSFTTEMTIDTQNLRDENNIKQLFEDKQREALRKFQQRSSLKPDSPNFVKAEQALTRKLDETFAQIVQVKVRERKACLERLNESITLAKTDIKSKIKEIRTEKSYLGHLDFENYAKNTKITWQNWFSEQLLRLGISEEEKFEEEEAMLNSFIETELNELETAFISRKSQTDQLVEAGSEMYRKAMQKKITSKSILGDFQSAHEEVANDIIQKSITKSVLKDNVFIENLVTELRLGMVKASEGFHEVYSSIQDAMQSQIQSMFERAKRLYEDNMNKQFENTKGGFFNIVELKEIHRRAKTTAINNIKAGTDLDRTHQARLDTEIDNIFEKFKRQNAMVEKSYNTSEAALGIDLGTTNCCVAVYHLGKITIIPSETNGNLTTPSYVLINNDGSKTVGSVAKDDAYKNPECTVFDAKRMIGRDLQDEHIKEDVKFWPFKVVEEGGRAKIRVHEKNYHPEEIASFILTHLKKEAESYLKSASKDLKVTKAVITVPAYFTDGQRQATIDAGQLAGLDVLGILNEPTAAAVAYRLNLFSGSKPKNILVYDLGGGTFDVAVLRMYGDKLDVLSVEGDCHLGGEDFDQNLMAFCAEEFKKSSGVDLFKEKESTNKNISDDARRRLRRLQLYCEKAKQALTAAEKSNICIDAFHKGDDFEVNITRDKFEAINMHLFKKTLGIVDLALKNARLKKEEIDDVVLVGGSTRILKLQEMLEKHFMGRPLNKRINPDEAVAHGAAVQAAILNATPGAQLFDFGQIQEVTPHSLGIEVATMDLSIIIDKGAKFPTELTKPYFTHANNQTSVLIKIYQGEQKLARQNKLLGKFELKGIPPAPAGREQIDVTMTFDVNGILSVTALCLSTRGRTGITVTEDKGRLTQAEKQQLLSNVSLQIT